MKCPFCGKQMYHPVGKATWSCQNWDCLKSEGMIGNHVLWQELIRTRKALEIAKDTFNWIDEAYQTGQETEAEIWGKVQLAAQEITALEQKDK